MRKAGEKFPRDRMSALCEDVNHRADNGNNSQHGHQCDETEAEAFGEMPIKSKESLHRRYLILDIRYSIFDIRFMKGFFPRASWRGRQPTKRRYSHPAKSKTKPFR